MDFNKDKVIKSWIALQSSELNNIEEDENFWVLEILDNLSDDEPNSCLEIITAICSATDDEWLLANVAAGPLEDLLGRNGEVVITEIEKMSINDLKFKKVLASVWRGSIDDKIWDRLKKITGSVKGF